MPIIHGEEGEIGSDAARRGTSDAVFNAFAHAALLKRHEPAEALLASRRAPWLGEALKRDPEKASGRLAIDYSRCSSSYSGIEGSFIMKRAKQHPFFGDALGLSTCPNGWSHTQHSASAAGPRYFLATRRSTDDMTNAEPP
ncbi:uncharacterized protein LOC109722311 isoform X2 [Ananas comosus]|uniref:Uncharacterized protein LOC109722311 isoform X2 n=1 Tax=Ananas comosus TaxID=4615 RepID=A0A6P5GIK0_ANACO|nr:uncharacterized protein LOC109722311 isoform X2 [Ananas comosus]